MALTARIPGMTPGATGRNLIVAFLYLGFFPLAIAFLILLIPIVFGIMVSRDSHGLPTRLDPVPGISAGGGILPGVVAVVIGFVVLGVVGAALPADIWQFLQIYRLTALSS